MIDNIELSRSAHALDLAKSRPANADGLNNLNQRWKESRDYSTLENRDREAVRARSLINGETPNALRGPHVKAILSGLRQPANDAESLDVRGRTATNLAGALKEGQLPNAQEQEVSQALREKFDGTVNPNIAPQWQEHVAQRTAAALAAGKTHLDPQEQTKIAEAVLERSTQAWIDPDLRDGAVSSTFMIPAGHSVDTGMMRAVGKKTQNILNREEIPGDAYATIAKHASTALAMNRFPGDVREDVATSLVQSLPKVSQAGSPQYSHVARMISDSAAVRGTAPNIDAKTIRGLSQNANLDDRYRPILARNADLREYQTNSNIQNFMDHPDSLESLAALNGDPIAKALIFRTFPPGSLHQISTQASNTAAAYRRAGDESTAAQWEAFSKQSLAAAQTRSTS